MQYLVIYLDKINHRSCKINVNNKDEVGFIRIPHLLKIRQNLQVPIKKNNKNISKLQRDSDKTLFSWQTLSEGFYHISLVSPTDREPILIAEEA